MMRNLEDIVHSQQSQSEIIVIPDIYARKLDNYRSIRIYLPPAYHSQPTRRFPVLYSHDGQNMFDGDQSYSGMSWNIHHVADHLIYSQMISDIIIVAVDNMAEERLSEYAHNDGIFQGQSLKGNGLLYEDFLINDLKPYIDEQFRTLPDAGNTALIGSSMGGLVTYNIGLNRPDIFGKLAIMSPSFWWSDGVTIEQIKSRAIERRNDKIWIDIGDAEGEFMCDCRAVVDELIHKGFTALDSIAYCEVPNANHSESAWAKRVHCPLLYFFGDIGEPLTLTLYGQARIGIIGPAASLNPVVSFTSDFRITALEPTYRVEQPELLDVKPTGQIVAKCVGDTRIYADALTVSTSKKISIVQELSAMVAVMLYVDVPDNTPDGPVFIGVRSGAEYVIPQASDGSYSAQLMLPRDEALNFKFTRGSWATVEKNMHGHDIDSRIIWSNDDSTHYYRVENWGDDQY